MARFVRCIEGHVFDGQTESVCPICGAHVGVGANQDATDPVPENAGAAADAATLPARQRFRLGRSRQIAFVLAVVVAGAALTLIPQEPRQPPVEQTPPAVEQRSTRLETLPDVPTEQPAPQPPPVPAPDPPSGNVWSSFRQLAKPTPQSGTADVGLTSLPEAQRKAINAAYAALLQWLGDDRISADFPPGDGDRFGTTPDGGALIPPRALLRAAIDAVARQGGWSDDAVAAAEYLRGRGELQTGSYGKAVDAMENAMRLGSPLALRHLGNLRTLGRKVGQGDPVAGAAYYKSCADRGGGLCALHLAGLHVTGIGVAKDAAETRRYFQLALALGVGEPNEVADRARRGQPEAIRQLAPYGVATRDLPMQTVDLYRARSERGLVETALALLARARRGDAAAIFGLAQMARDKEALSLPEPMRLTLLREAARRGHAEAMNHLGGVLIEGPAELRQPGEALFWFFAAAAHWSKPIPPGRQPGQGYNDALRLLPADERPGLETFFATLARALNETPPAPRRP